MDSVAYRVLHQIYSVVSSLGTCYGLHIHQFVEVLYFQVFEHLEVQSALLFSVTIIDNEIVSMFLFHCTKIRSCMLESNIHKPMQKWQACLPQSKWCRISWSKQPILWSNSQGYKNTWMELHSAETVSHEWKAHIWLKQYDELYRGKAFMIFYDQSFWRWYTISIAMSVETTFTFWSKIWLFE